MEYAPRFEMLHRVLLLLAVSIWGSGFVATKVLLREIGPVEVLALRLALGLPFLGVMLWLRGVRFRFTRDDARTLFLGSVILTVHFLVQIGGLVTATAINTGWIISVSPLALALLASVFLGERLGWRSAAGIGVATAGIVLLVSRGELADLGWLRSTGDWLVLASAHTWAIYTVATRDLVRRRDPLAVTFTILVLMALNVALLFVAVADVAAVRALSPQAILALVYVSIPGLALGQWFWQEGVARVGATRAGFYLYLEPLVSVAVAVPLLGESFGPVIALGGALVLLGVFLGQRDRKSRSGG